MLHHVRQTLRKRNLLCLFAEIKMNQFTFTPLWKKRRNWAVEIMWQQSGWHRFNSCKQTQQWSMFSSRSAVPLFFSIYLTPSFSPLSSPLSLSLSPSTIWLSLMSIAHVPPSFFAPPKRKENPVPSYVVQPTAPLQQQIWSCSSQLSELVSNKYANEFNLVSLRDNEWKLRWMREEMLQIVMHVPLYVAPSERAGKITATAFCTLSFYWFLRDKTERH